jgi:hypothetical protein
MHGPIKVKSPNNTSKWQMGFNSAFKGLKNIDFWVDDLEGVTKVKPVTKRAGWRGGGKFKFRKIMPQVRVYSPEN